MSDGPDKPFQVLYSIDVIEHVNMGDHGERLRTSHEAIHGETVEEMILRVFPKIKQQFATHDVTDTIEIRAQIAANGDLPNYYVKMQDPFLGPPSDEPPF